MTPTTTQLIQQYNLNPDDYFYCIKEKCTMRKALCLDYQKQAQITVRTSYVVGFNTSVVAAERFHCKNCEQGKEIKEEQIC